MSKVLVNKDVLEALFVAHDKDAERDGEYSFHAASTYLAIEDLRGEVRTEEVATQASK